MVSLRTPLTGLTPRQPDELSWRHAVLLLTSTGAAAATSSIVMGAAFLLPTLQGRRGVTLATAGTVIAMPQVGILLALLPWGVAVDRLGERAVLISGLFLTALATGLAGVTTSLWSLGLLLLLAGAAAASTNVASGRVVVGWFPASRRGLAMGIRQMSTPLGAALAALTIPVLAPASGVARALAVPAAACAVAGVLVVLAVADPARPERDPAHATVGRNPYARDHYLLRIHAASVLLVIPQGVMSAFLLLWLMAAHGWSALSAGALVTVGQLLGAAGRIAAGAWSDHAGSRMRPLRVIAGAAAVCACLLAIADAAPDPVRAAAPVVAVALTVVAVADNGLSFTAVAEYAGPFWSGRALSLQNAGQFLVMAAATPAAGWMIERQGYPGVFAITAAAALLALPLVPRMDRLRIATDVS